MRGTLGAPRAQTCARVLSTLDPQPALEAGGKMRSCRCLLS